MRINIDVRKQLTTRIKVKLRGGIEERFDVKYERPPLLCFFCGKLGHGVKDCAECLDIENPLLKYGGWIKASPWRRLNQEEKTDELRKPDCARVLFTVRPKEKVLAESKKQVEEVLGKLTGCRIEEMLGERSDDNGCKSVTQKDDKPPPKGGHDEGVLGENSYQEWDNQAEEVLPSNGQSGVLKESTKKKGWRRLKSHKQEVMKEKIVITGMCRKRDEGTLMEEVIDQQSNGVSKKRQVDYFPSGETMTDSLDVAVPTTWALGEQ